MKKPVMHKRCGPHEFFDHECDYVSQELVIELTCCSPTWNKVTCKSCLKKKKRIKKDSHEKK